jgi:hypothetical protein
MDPVWKSEFRARMQSFESQRPPHGREVSVSLKVRIISGCFHREHSPHAYTLIDQQLASIPSSQRPEFAFVEHESGPELLVYLALTTAGVTLAKSVIDLIISIIKARAEGIKAGDRPSDPIEVIVRRVGDGDKYAEETVLRIGYSDSTKPVEIEARINEALKRLVSVDPKTANKQLKGTRCKRRTHLPRH